MNEIIRDIKTKLDGYLKRIEGAKKDIEDSQRRDTATMKRIKGLETKVEECEAAIAALESLKK